MRNFRLLRSMPVLQTLQDWQIMRLHTSPPKSQTWSHFQFLRKPRNSSVQASQKLSSIHSNNTSNQRQTNFSKASTPNYSSEISKNQVFYSTCSKPPKKPDCPPKKSDCPPKKSECPPKKSECPPKKKECAPPKKMDCAPKPKKCPEKSSCDSDYYEKNCPDQRGTASCSTNKPKCPEKKCQDPPKPKPKAKACNPPEEKSVCSKPPPKPSSGCGGGKNPPPCGSRSFSSYGTAQPLAMTSNKSFGDEQCEKIQEICGKSKGKCDDSEAIADVNTGKDESFDDRMKREKEEMVECLKEKTDFTGIDPVRIYYSDFIRDIISRDEELFKESDLHEELFDKNRREVHDKGIVSRNGNNWIFPQFIY